MLRHVDYGAKTAIWLNQELFIRVTYRWRLSASLMMTSAERQESILLLLSTGSLINQKFYDLSFHSLFFSLLIASSAKLKLFLVIQYIYIYIHILWIRVDKWNGIYRREEEEAAECRNHFIYDRSQNPVLLRIVCCSVVRMVGRFSQRK